MLKNPTTSLDQEAPSPFFDLLAEADEVQIREVAADDREAMTTAMEKAIEAFDSDNPLARRTFFVHIKAKPGKAPETPLTNSPEDKAYLLSNAEVLLKHQDYLLARNIFSYLLKVDIRDQRALRGLGICLLKLGEVTSAKKCFRALLELYPTEETHWWLGICAAQEGQDAMALDHFGRIESIEAWDADQQLAYYREMGNAYFRLGKLDGARERYQKALTLQPHCEPIHVNLGTVELQRGHLDEAHRHFQRAVELNPQSSKARSGLGLVALARGQKLTAEKELLTALDLDSQNLVALYPLISLAEGTTSHQQVQARLVAFLDREPKHLEMRYALAVMRFKAGDWASCEKEVQTILKADPCFDKARKLRDEVLSHKHQN